MVEDQNARFGARPGQEVSGESFGEAFKRHKAAGRAAFSWRGQTYSTKTAQEQGREIKAAPGSGRGTAAGRTAADRDTPTARAESTAPASRPRASLSDIPGLIARGMSEGADRVPAGRGLGAAFVGAGAGSAARTAMAGAKAARDWRDTPPAGADPSKWQAIVRQIDEKYPGGATPSGGMSKEALAKELAKDMSSGSMGRGTPMRSTATTSDTGRRFTPAEEMEAVTSAARGAAGRKAVQEARTGRSQAAAEAKAEKPILRTDKSSETPRSRTRDEEDVDFKKGGKVKAYAKGGSVRGSGIAQRGVKPCKVY